MFNGHNLSAYFSLVLYLLVLTQYNGGFRSVHRKCIGALKMVSVFKNAYGMFELP